MQLQQLWAMEIELIIPALTIVTVLCVKKGIKMKNSKGG